MGVSASVTSAAYEGRQLRLVVEQLWYESGQSYVAWKLYSEGGAASYYGIGPITVTINGTVVYSKAISYYSGGTAAFPVATGSVSGSLYITHSASKTITASLDGYVYMDTGAGPYTTTLTLTATSSGGDTSGGSTGDYSATPILFVTGGEIGSYCTVCFAPDWEGYSYQLGLYSADDTLILMKRLTPKSSGTLLEEQLLLSYTLADYIDLTGTAKIKLSTYRSSTFNSSYKVGSDSVWVLDVQVVENDQTRPQITNAVFGPSPDPLDGAYVQNKTGVLGRLTAEGKYGATIASLWFRVEGKNYDSGQVSALLSQYGQLTVTAYAVDSRGFYSTGVSYSLEALPYSAPKLRPVDGQSRVAAVRCDEEGKELENGAYLIIMARREYSQVVWEDAQRNFCAIKYRWKPDVSSAWSDWMVILEEGAETDSVTTGPLIGTLDPKSAYQVEIQAVDTLGGAISTVLTVYSDRIFWHRHGALGSLGFGKYVEEANVLDISSEKTLKVRGGLELTGDAYAAVLDLCHPVGSVLETVRTEDPGDSLGGTWMLMEQTESTYRWRRTE